MFSKIKSYFKKQNNAEGEFNRFKHPQMTGGDASQCPFMNKNKNASTLNKNEQKQNKKQKKNPQSQSDSETQEKPRGGCPFMASSGTKKNPNLGIYHQGYDEPFVSKFKYYLSCNKIDFNALKQGKKHEPYTRHIFDKFPIYLKHTLFFNGEDYKKIRSFECCSRFLAYEQLRQKGNKNYNKGKYLKAIDYYERAMSLFRWLDYKQKEENESLISQNNIQQISSQSEIADDQLKQKIPINLGSEHIGLLNSQKNSQFDEFREKYKQFFVIYHDDNVVCNDGQEMTQTVDTDMRKSLLIQLYLNMAAAYLKLNHFSLANQVLDDALKLSDRVSQVYMRKAQVALSNKSSSIKELKNAAKNIQRAIQMQPHEKIFQNTNPNILKMCNIHDAKEVYAEVLQKIQKKIQKEAYKINQITDSIEVRLEEINQVEKQIIKEGKVPQQSKDSHLLSEGTDYKILKRIHDKYVRIMEFYIQAKDLIQIQLAKKQFQQILRVMIEIKTIQDLEINILNQKFGHDEKKIKNRIKNIKRKKCQQIYNTAKYNFQVLQWAIKEIVKQEHAEKQERKNKQEEKGNVGNNQNHGIQEKSKWANKLPYAMIILPVMGILINYMI